VLATRRSRIDTLLGLAQTF